MAERDKFTLTAAQGSSERLSLLRLEQIIALLNTITAKLDSDAGVTDDNYQALLADLKTIAEQITHGDINK